ncbi:uncharacterized protein FIBRA_08191 [Fibroporia radiculosa]|uniref:Uncharacterized protein n=1 Tax=Fibroporia radiculosa TaxID=599839 RepID=J4I2C3_9APHY|nr:uncharacterized protein FIBRA_08191 [Fibroporia radiculosa]CCM05952.1 predicted protein [Fibroporia radiculosa]
MQKTSAAEHLRDVSRYTVQSSDVLSDMRVNVSEEGSDKVLWFLADEEIVDNFVDNATSTILWTIHRPKRGWYIRLRTPSFPPGMFIPLLPLPKTSLYHSDTALTFTCRTNPPSYSLSNSQSAAADTDFDAVHSYPPSSPPLTPTVIVSPPSPRSAHAKLEESKPIVIVPSNNASSKEPQSPTEVTPSSPKPVLKSGRKEALRPSPLPLTPMAHFLLSPDATPRAPQSVTGVSIFSRVLSALKSSTPSPSYSFTMSPITTPSATPPSSGSPRGLVPPTPAPLLTFHDRTPVWTVYASSGCIELDKMRVRSLGVETSFYIAIALTYLDFLSERDSYLAALGD